MMSTLITNKNSFSFRTRALFFALFLLAVMFILHYFNLKYTIYFYLPYIDILMHFLGGVALGFLFLWLVNTFTKLEKGFIPFVLFSLIAWEVFEVMYVIDLGGNYVPDTILDLLFGSLGVIMSIFIARSKSFSEIQ